MIELAKVTHGTVGGVGSTHWECDRSTRTTLLWYFRTPGVNMYVYCMLADTYGDPE